VRRALLRKSMLFVNLDSANFYMEIASTKETNSARVMYIFLTNIEIKIHLR
jgi:hypothetical protein